MKFLLSNPTTFHEVSCDAIASSNVIAAVRHHNRQFQLLQSFLCCCTANKSPTIMKLLLNQTNLKSHFTYPVYLTMKPIFSGVTWTPAIIMSPSFSLFSLSRTIKNFPAPEKRKVSQYKQKENELRWMKYQNLQ